MYTHYHERQACTHIHTEEKLLLYMMVCIYTLCGAEEEVVIKFGDCTDSMQQSDLYLAFFQTGLPNHDAT